MENFDRENIDELLEICQYFPHQNFVPYGILHRKCMIKMSGHTSLVSRPVEVLILLLFQPFEGVHDSINLKFVII